MTPETAHLLNRLLAIHCKSFPQYLLWSRPYVPDGRGAILDTVHSIVTDQNVMADRISQLLIDGGSLPHTGDFPMEFTDLHDLDIDFLVDFSINYQTQDVAKIDALVDSLRTSPAAKAVAEEALGMAKGHLETLQELRPTAANA